MVGSKKTKETKKVTKELAENEDLKELEGGRWDGGL